MSAENNTANKTVIYWDGLAFSVKLTLAQLLYIALVSFVGIVLLLTFVQKFRNAKSSVKLSIQLKIHLAAWTCFMFCPFIYSLPTLLFWKGQDTEYSLFFTCLKGSLNSAALTIAPLSTGFLTADRIIILLFPTMRRSLIWIQVTSGAVMTVAFILVFMDRFRYSYFNNIEISTTTKCISFACLTVGQSIWRNIKFILGWANLVLGIYFIFVYYRYGRQIKMRREKRKSILVVWILCSELFLNILPVTISLDSYGSALSSVSSAFGSILTPCHVTDGLAQAIIFWKTWNDRFNIGMNLKTVTPQANLHNNTGSTMERTKP